jgi:hypothetical protein
MITLFFFSVNAYMLPSPELEIQTIEFFLLRVDVTNVMHEEML